MTLPPRARWIQRIRVPLGFVFGALYLVLATPVFPFLQLGLPIALLGLSVRLWAAGHLHKQQQLATSGPYSRTRNPLYLGSFLMGLGFSVAAANGWLLFLFLLLFAVIYIPVMKREEGEMQQAFGRDFEHYRDSVPRFWPRLTGTNRSLAGNFQWRRVILNREYNAVVGFLLLAGYLLFRTLWS